ncbi:LysR family transcriptional regulator [Lysinibacillus cavernae]|uniref:LysR family transcriptional regulator n=1 Tax=Lysinibacillus cavernae TaxID=2666135 RepID=UPI0012D9FA96|nr:LysR family transcriptional regulator [Lysinibacillus cavernae]
MDIRQLRYFIAIVEEKKISAAAERLHISQPPLSQHLKTMEEELGSKLVERKGKFFKVTEAGKTLYKYALQVVQLMEEAEVEVKDVGLGIHGRLTLGINTFSVVELPSLLHQFQQLYPKVTYKIQQNESSYLCKLVRDRVVELAIIRLPLVLDDFSVLHMSTEPFYFIQSNKNDRIEHEVTLAEIQNWPLLLPSTEGLGVHYSILEAFSRYQYHTHIVGECSDTTLLMNLVATGFSSSIVPETILKQYEELPLHAYKIPSEEICTSVGLVWMKNHYLSKAAQNFVDLMRKHYC